MDKMDWGLIGSIFLAIILITFIGFIFWASLMPSPYDSRCAELYGEDSFSKFSDYEHGFFGCCIPQYNDNHVRIDDICFTLPLEEQE